MLLARLTALRIGMLSPLLFWIVQAAECQIRDCPGASTEIGFKVLFDDISFDPAATANQSVDMTRLTSILRVKIQNDDATFRVVAAKDAITTVPCAGRRPQSVSDFDKSAVEQLDLRQVVLEVWGTVQRQDRNGVKGHLASIEYTLIPARRSQLDSGTPPGVYASERWVRPAAPADEILNVFGQSDELVAYARIGAGIKSSKLTDPKEKYDQAFQYLCRGAAILKKEGSDKLASPQASLLDYVQTLARRIFQAARQDPGYIGWMKLETGPQASDNCPEVR